MIRVWTWGTVAAIVVSFGVAVGAQQATTKPATQKPVVKKEAKQEKEDGEKAEAKKPAAKVQLPAAVTAAFKKSYPDAVIKNSAKETEGGKTVYEVESVDKGMNRDLIYNPDGTVVEFEEQIKPADLPAPVAAALKQLYPKATITKAEKLMNGETIQYEMALKGTAKPSATFTPDGKLVPAPPPEKK